MIKEDKKKCGNAKIELAVTLQINSCRSHVDKVK